MEWHLIAAIPSVLGLAIGFLAGGWTGFGEACVCAFLWVLFTWLFMYDIFTDTYKEWKKDGQGGDHPWFEWRYCLESWRWVKAKYDDKTFCKIRLGRFKKFFAVNPKRYKLRESWAVCDDGRPEDLIMFFPRRDLFGYYRFRRDWLQTRRLQDVTGYVQSDIEAARKEAQKQIEEARKLMAKGVEGLAAPWDSGGGKS